MATKINFISEKEEEDKEFEEMSLKAKGRINDEIWSQQDILTGLTFSSWPPSFPLASQNYDLSNRSEGNVPSILGGGSWDLHMLDLNFVQ